MKKFKTDILAVRETERRGASIRKYLNKDDSSVSEVYRQVNDDILSYKGVPPYLKKGQE